MDCYEITDHRNDAGERFVALPLVSRKYVVQECGFHVKPLFGFQFLQDCSEFLQIRSHSYMKVLSPSINVPLAACIQLL